MMSDSTILVLLALLTWLMLCTSSGLRIQTRREGGMERAFGNRDDLPEPTPLAGRADRAAKNMVENLAMFVALMAAVHFAGKASAQATLGANIFFWSRLAFWPCYLAGIHYLRTAIWMVSLIGMILIAAAALW
jgi:uncharacterized MAPEG superfamily protein